ncbi:hypothetical protein OG896_24760 [Streptomyces sp. NBC_00669]|uniref:hypothetical protein n=1 Tax=Streptomyces sp. NBC_00669 TaxID=2976011 RepID=UPI002E352973|nr:hypothetical protein [Streptomyces sp. NBC_00669]
MPEHFIVDAQTRLASPGYHEDRLTIRRAGDASTLQYVALPHDAHHSLSAALGALGWQLVTELEYFARSNVERARVEPVAPETTPEADAIRSAIVREATARLVADRHGVHFHPVLPADSPYPIGWTYRTAHAPSCQYSWVTGQGHAAARPGYTTREEAEHALRESAQNTSEARAPHGAVEAFSAAELGTLSATLRQTDPSSALPLTDDHALELLSCHWAGVQEVQPARAADRLLGWTFRIDTGSSAQYGWITSRGTRARALEDQRSAASATLAYAVRDEDLAAGRPVDADADTAAIAATESIKDAPTPQWRTLKGLATPFLLWGREDGDRFRPARDRKQVSGTPVTVVRTWMSGSIRYGEDESGREIHLWGAAAKHWAAPSS